MAVDMNNTITCFGATDTGLKRTNNEDTFAVRPDLGLCIVSDGMGGAAAGELASRIFAETTLEVFSNAFGGSEKETADRVQRSFVLANERILKHVHENPEHKGMGCTAEVVAFFSGSFVLGHMGDSRTYRLRNGVLKQLSNDHSLVQEQLDQGVITEAEAKSHPMRNIILRAVGVKESVTLDLSRGKTLKDDLFMLCSDGLTDMVDDERISEVLHSPDTLQRRTATLIELAKAAGGRDNITVVLAQVG
jgi:PPM family protein phosphatase